MKATSILKKSLLGLAVLPLLLLAGVGKASAAQIPYVPGEALPVIDHPAFNVFTNLPFGTGNEADFVRVRPSTGDPTDKGANGVRNGLYKNVLNAACNVSDMFDVRTYVHNGADDDLNNNGTGPAVAKNVNLTMTAPLNTAGKTFIFNSTITASNAATVNDTGRLNCGDNVKLEIVPGTVKVYSKTLGWVNASIDAVNGTIKLGSRVFGSGDVWGCWNDVMSIVYTVKVVKVPAPNVPLYSCDLLTSTGKISDNRFGFKVKVTAKNGAVLKNITYKYSDGTTDTDDETTSHRFTTDAERKSVKAIANFTVNGKTKSHTDDKCEVEFTQDKPTVLPRTGAGSTLAIFAATSTLGAFLYRLRALRGEA